MTITALDPAQLRHAFGAFPSGVVAVAARVDGALTGMAASSFTSVSLDPPLVSFSVANGSSTWPLLQRSERLGLSVLADHHGAACRRLAGPAAQRFEGLDVTDAAGGAVLLPDAVTTFECVIQEELPAGDHTIVLLRLVDWHEGSGSPLVFHRSAFARLRDALAGGVR